MINLDYRSGKSIHEQIQSGIKELIISGVLKEGDQLPSVREMSINLTVNPNTVQKAYKELESNGVIYSVKGKGNFVSKPTLADDRQKEKLLNDLRKILGELKFAGVDKNNVNSVTEEIYKEDKND